MDKKIQRALKADGDKLKHGPYLLVDCEPCRGLGFTLKDDDMVDCPYCGGFGVIKVEGEL